MSLLIEQLTVTAGNFALTDLSLEIPTAKCAVLMGKSGSGKTTLMEALCGLRKVTHGRIVLDGRDITHLRPGERGIGLVPQDTVLFPHMSVREHLAFGPKLAGWGKAAISERIDALASSLDIVSLLERRPQGLSGGEAKRVSLGRALAFRPSLLCLDEALTGLDTDTRYSIMHLIQRIVREEKITTLHITHHQDEADMLADRHYSILNGLLRKRENAQEKGKCTKKREEIH